ncbi:MAG TPA: protein-L-isoaspartate(D-aspartate) O-methyltransferase [Burkholderiaceae bacterium]|nr:protein-L-isoaspartate(D-aspartate) O-methyltransferase [Burkholderiaceae bacterium]
MSGAGKGARKFPLRLDALNPRRDTTPRRVPKATPKPAPKAAPAAPAPRLQATAAAARTLLRPQRPLDLAHGDASRRAAPSGLGLDSADVRRRMAQRLRASGVRHEAVLEAMATVPRHRFVDAALVTQAYEDTSLPIGHGQTISKPSVVARMIELLMDGATARAARSLGRVLEIGTGCGYQAAVLASLATSVISVERLQPLHAKARELLAPMRPANLRLVYGDGMRGHPPNAPYDSIIAAAGGDALPDAWLDQLAVGGRLVSPVRQGGSDRQTLMVVDRHADGYERHTCEAVHFVPLKSGLVSG